MAKKTRCNKTVGEIFQDMAARFERNLARKICTHVNENGDPCSDCILFIEAQGTSGRTAFENSTNSQPEEQADL